MKAARAETFFWWEVKLWWMKVNIIWHNVLFIGSLLDTLLRPLRLQPPWNVRWTAIVDRLDFRGCSHLLKQEPVSTRTPLYPIQGQDNIIIIFNIVFVTQNFFSGPVLKINWWWADHRKQEIDLELEDPDTSYKTICLKYESGWEVQNDSIYQKLIILGIRMDK